MESVSIFLSLFPRTLISLQKKWPIAAAILSIAKGVGGGRNNLENEKALLPLGTTSDSKPSLER